MSLIVDDAIKVLCDRLERADITHVILSTWKSFELFSNRNVKKALLSALRRGCKIQIIVGGTKGSLAYNTFLLDVRKILNNKNIRIAFKKGDLVFAHDRNTNSIHAKCWVFYNKNKIESISIGSFNLTSNSFTKNLEAAISCSPDRQLNQFISRLSRHVECNLLNAQWFFDNEEKFVQNSRVKDDCAWPKGQEPSYLQQSKRLTGGGSPRGPKKRGKVGTSPRFDDYLVVLRNPSRGEIVGYKIPLDLLEKILGEDFVRVRQTAHGTIEPPKSQVFPFPPDMKREYNKIHSSMAQLMQRFCRPTSIGYVLVNDQKEAFDKALENIKDRATILADSLHRFRKTPSFKSQISVQMEAIIKELHARYRRGTRFPQQVFNQQIAINKAHIENLGKDAAKKIIKKLENMKDFSFIELEVLIDGVTGISRSELAEELLI